MRASSFAAVLVVALCAHAQGETGERETWWGIEETLRRDVVVPPPFTGPTRLTEIWTGVGALAGGVKASRPKPPPQPTPQTEEAVELGLDWLEAQQDAATGAIGDTEDTALALLAMLGAGYTELGPKHRNRHARCVREALGFLLRVQDPRGSFADPSRPRWIRTHAIATLAVVEAYWMTNHPRHRVPLRKALDLLSRLRTASAGWCDGTGTKDDILTTAWATLAMRCAKHAWLEVDPAATEGIRALLAARRPTFTPAEEAAALFTWIQCGECSRHSETVLELAARVALHRPEWPADGAVPVDLWHFGTLAMFQVGDAPWKSWNDAMVKVLVSRQLPKEHAGPDRRTWPIGPDIGDQAKLTMCLEVYYRYDRINLHGRR